MPCFTQLDKLVAMVDNNLPVVEEPEEYSDEEDMDMDAGALTRCCWAWSGWLAAV